MKALVTYKKNEWCNKIAEKLDEEFEDFHYIYASSGRMEVVNKDESIRDHYHILIRFGTYANYLPSADIVYNSYKGIKLTSNKLKARKVFKDNFVPTPRTYSRYEIWSSLQNGERLPDKVIGRTKTHSGGKGLEVFNSREELRDELERGGEIHYFSEFYPKSKEFRVHIASGKAIIVAEKVVDEDKQDRVVWNLGDEGACEDFKTLRWSEYYDIEEIIKSASLATRVLGLDYGAVDIVAYPKEKRQLLPPVAVLEVNSAPRLEEYGISRYVEYFKWLFLHNEKAEFMLPHTLDRFSFTHSDFENDYERLKREQEERE